MTTKVDMLPHLQAIEADRSVYVAEHGQGTEGMYDTALADLAQLHSERKANVVNFATYNLPQLPDNRAEIYERIREAEARVASPTLDKEGYIRGAAQVVDERLVLDGQSGVLLTAEHATQQMRLYADGPRKAKEADYGTGGLGLVVHEDTNSPLIIPVGLQTGDANSDVDHWMKDEMHARIANRSVGSHISLHSIGRTLVSSLIDERPFSIMLGIGNSPNDQTYDMAQRIKGIAEGYDLRVGINEPFIAMQPTAPTRPHRREDGSIRTITFAAAGKGTSRRASEVFAAEVDPNFASIQIEMSSVLTYQPENLASYPGKKSQEIGIHIGYLFTKDCVKLLAA